ncbi:ATP phosphoribosyltransferase regulatory subunit [Thiomicrospira sp. ALE5]|uniref:ATP phosphoribosyltransferase regulatory subunit n=1 Tax=Thiomicrospira sp. ALE5 TaxID=748650 RepID=UPI0008F345C7|nr:ATP phosphoribosyltransferase regulatory subunit [Thiomicrospira sp. ALE5]SFR59027.1 ATP phosphoribosyltransferase regulatory subunit [Thiomicrospira sp. ALE5]
MQQNIWLTPEGIEDLLPPQAARLEFYRRHLVDTFTSAGYDLVLPPVAEFTDSLLTGTGRKLALDTCRFTDNESGRMMGVRADMTPQVARIVSNRLKPSANAITRLCYVGEVLKSRNNKAKGSRSPIQVGAELFGHQGIASDIEMIDLMLSGSQALGFSNVSLSLGHVGIVQRLMNLAQLDTSNQNELVDILKRKALPEYQAWLDKQAFSASLTLAFASLITFTGEATDVLTAASQSLLGLDAELDQCLQDLNLVVDYFVGLKGIDIHLDLADLRGFQYHTGLIFACYQANVSSILIAKGGRYDRVCSAFGADYPATGFSIDLRNLIDSLADQSVTDTPVYAIFEASESWLEQVNELKISGKRVIRAYQIADIPAGAQQLLNQDGQWVIKIKE